MAITTGAQFGHYRILTLLGAGGMGEVYLAQDTRLDRKVAVKFLSEEYSRDTDKLNRFIQEARAASALNHPNILTVYEIGEAVGAHFIATEFIEGKTLREHLSPKAATPLNQILKIGVQVSEALSAAHHAGIIHRDIKPENIMIRADGYAKVLDFGLAKLTEQKPADEVLSEDTTKGLVKTNPGMVMGTVAYMSPEQARGKDTDARTDIWSLGVVLYEMLSGKQPFTGETVNHTIVSILEKEPHLLENVPDELQRIVRKTLTKDKEMRYQTARDLLIDLKNLRRNLDIQGELERSVIPNRETQSAQENETQIYAAKSIEETKPETSQSATHASSLEYAVTQAKNHKLATTVTGIILLSIISAITYLGFFAKQGAKQIESIAVLPFQNESANSDIEYLSDGMTETLISSLSQIPKLNVKARSSVFRYKGKEINLPKIARELNVQAILTGRVAQRGEQLILNLELVDAATENLLWAEQYNRKQTDLVSLQTEITRDVSNKLWIKISGAEEQQLAKSHTTNPQAYQLYLKGRFHWNKRTPDDYKKAVEYFNQALKLDSRYALAYTGLADSYALLAIDNAVPPREYMPKAHEAVIKAISLDDASAEAHASLGQILHNYDYDFTGAEREYRRAIELNPNYASAHQWYGELLASQGRFEESFAEYRRALDLDPISLAANRMLGWSLVYAKKYQEGISQLKKTTQLDADYAGPHFDLSKAYYLQNMYAESVEEFVKAQELSGNRQNALLARESFAKGGWQGYLRTMTEKHEPSSLEFYFLAILQTALGEKSKAIELLNKSYEKRENTIIWLKVDPRFDPLRGDPRFEELLRRVGFP